MKKYLFLFFHSYISSIQFNSNILFWLFLLCFPPFVYIVT